MTFIDIATPLAEMGIPITPVRPGTKAAFLPNFPTTATTNLEQLNEWNKLYSDCNAACVARAEEGGVWFFEVDSKDVLPRLERETGQKMPTTFKVRSRPGRGHFYFRHTPASMGMGNISQTYVVGQDWSVRTNREYVVGPGSIHPDTKLPYTALNWGTPIIEAPDWLVRWLISQKIQKQSAAPTADTTPRNERGRVGHGAIHGFLLSQAGRLRAAGLTQEEIEPALLRIAHEQCEEPLDDSKIIKMSHSICNFPVGEARDIALTQTQAVAPPLEPDELEPEERPNFDELEYPLFPTHVMFDTSIYEGFAKPSCATSSRIDYFVWLPTAVMMMNYIGQKVSVPFRSWKPNFYIVIIGDAGESHKSSSIKAAMRYMEQTGCVAHYGKDIKSADGRSLIFEVGSSEGLGTDMMRTNCKNVILYYDELSALVSKARIDGSSLNSTLLKMYDSNGFSNSIKAKKDTFNILPDTYCTSLITATTTEKFNELWSQLGGADSGLDQRFTFVLQPEVLPAPELEKFADYNDAARITRQRIEAAVNRREFNFFDTTPFKRILEVHGSRIQIRAEKWALYFAIDMGLSEIDEDCVYRGIEMAKYEHAAEKYMEKYEALNDDSHIQQGILKQLRRRKGEMRLIELQENMHAWEYGLYIWNRSFSLLVTSGYIAVSGNGRKGSPKMVHMLRDMRTRKS